MPLYTCSFTALLALLLSPGVFVRAIGKGGSGVGQSRSSVPRCLVCCQSQWQREKAARVMNDRGLLAGFLWTDLPGRTRGGLTGGRACVGEAGVNEGVRAE
ncbi:hypothetical protein LZ31DRAFT_169094 [Colletotrichum somersetense]|nr:hypothetical protein LZ31DRAFT_169094 [Colletotrichum somersetense]